MGNAEKIITLLGEAILETGGRAGQNTATAALNNMQKNPIILYSLSWL